MLAAGLFAALMASCVSALATPIMNAPLERVPTWDLTFNINSERDRFPISIDVLGNYENNGLVCVDAPSASWATVTITPKSANATPAKKIKNCDANQVWIFKELCPSGAETPPKAKGQLLANPVGVKRKPAGVPADTQSFGLLCA